MNIRGILSPYCKFEKLLIKKYPRYELYQVCGVTENGERVPLYRECENLGGGELNKAI